MDFSTERKAMVDSQVRVNDVTDRAVHAAMMVVPRESFCAADRAFAAYADSPVDIAGERKLMAARDVSKLLQAASARAGEKALAIAAPYAAAVLARIGLTVTAQESDEAVMAVVAPALESEGVAAVVAPLSEAHGSEWDLIVCEGGVASLPASWGKALREGGRMVLVERTGTVGKAVVYVKGRDGALSRREVFDSAPAILSELIPAPSFAL